MRLALSVALLIVAVVGAVAASDVIELTDENFSDELAKHNPIFVEFYAPWCGHCKNLAPEWETVATELVGQVAVAKIDASTHGQAAQEYSIQGFPTLKWIQDGVASDYNGARDAGSMISWARRRLQPIPHLHSAESVELARSVSSVWVLFNFDAEHEAYATIKQYALSSEDVTFISVSGEAAAGIEPGQIVVASDWLPQRLYTGSVDELPAWINRNAYPLVQKVEANGALVFNRLFTSGLPFALVFLNNDDALAANLAELDAVAEQLRHSFLFAWLDTAQWGEVLPRLGASGNVVPTAIAWADPQSNQRPLVFDEDVQFTFVALKAWADQIISGQGTTWKQSQPVPEQTGPVHQLVWKTWESEVDNSPVPVFVEFYSPWCGHCKNLEPAWNELAAALNPEGKVVVANYDATANFLKEEWSIQGFPTMKLFKKDAEPIDYNGARDFDSMLAFIQENI